MLHTIRQRPLFSLSAALLGAALAAQAGAQGTTVPITTPLRLNPAVQLRLQAVPNFGAAPIFRTLDATASTRFLNGNTIWLTAQGLQANQAARAQTLTANLARLQLQAARPQVQAVLRAVQAQGLREPQLTVPTRSGPLTVTLLGADVGASLAASRLGQDFEQVGRSVGVQVARDLNLPADLIGRVAQAAPQQRLNVVTQIQPDLLRALTRLDVRALQPEGTADGLDAAPSGCAASASGLFTRYDFPIKKHLPAAKNQGGRGTCWAFASVGLTETLISRTFGRKVDLSEEDFVANYKLRYGSPTDGDGAWTEDALTKGAQTGYRFAYENAWQYNQSLKRTATETPAKSGKFLYAKSCTDYPFQNQCEDSVSQAETGCILADGKTVCGAQLPATRSPYGLNTGAMRNFLDPEQPEGGMGWAVLAVVTGTPVLMTHDARYLTNSGGFVGDLPYSAVSHEEDTPTGKKWVPNTEKDLQNWNHVALLVGWIGNEQLAKVSPGAPAGAGGGYFIMKNSWSSCFGDGGYVYLPWNWVKKYAGALTFGAQVTRN
ncbi:C1 family peptidase [Deinococcus ficus]|uniref:C1 family peptidase n=1 Tax=Deinococcus ficus TaxID=317577 RepID=UPI0003B71708|nr:C1 family peptidase [Deinococcus ficus]